MANSKKFDGSIAARLRQRKLTILVLIKDN